MTTQSFLPPQRDTTYSVERARLDRLTNSHHVYTCPVCENWQVDAARGVPDSADLIEEAVREHMDPCLAELDRERFGEVTS